MYNESAHRVKDHSLVMRNVKVMVITEEKQKPKKNKISLDNGRLEEIMYNYEQ